MKKTFLLLTAAMGIFFFSFASAFRVATFDLHKVLQNDPQVKVQQDQLNDQFKPDGQKIIDLRKQINDDFAQLQNAAAIQTSTRQLLANRIVAGQKDLQTQQTDYQQKLLAAQNDALVKILVRVKKVVKGIADQEHFDLVLTQDNVAYSPQSTDITNQVVKALKKTA